MSKLLQSFRETCVTRRLFPSLQETTAFLRACAVGLMGTGGTTSQQLARGGVWVFVSYGLEQVLSLIRSVILARLLTPADFGLMGMASLSLAFLNVFTQTGIWAAIIQRPEVDQPTLSTAWLISVVRGLILGLIIFLSAPGVALFFEAPLLGPLLRVMALSLVLGGLNSLGLVLLQREMDFRTLAVFGLVTSLANLLAATITAVLLRSVWALVIGTLSGSVAALLMSYVVHPFRPAWQFSRQRARELLDFGKFLTASSVVNYALTQGDDAYVGKVLGPQPLGFYEVAYRLSNLPATSISHVIGRVTLPAYSAMQDDLDRLRRTYLRILKLTALASFPMAVGLFSLAPLIIRVLYGEKWMSMVSAFQILCAFGLERSIGAPGSSVFLALGKPDIGLRVQMVKLITMALCIAPLTGRYGIAGTSMAVTLSAIAVQSALVPVVSKLLGLHWFQVLKPLLKPLTGSLLMMTVLLVLRSLSFWTGGAWQLMVLILVGALVYGLFVAVTEKALLRESWVRIASWGSSLSAFEEA